MSRRKVWLHWMLLIVMMFSFAIVVPAIAQDDKEKGTKVYWVPNVFTAEERSAIAATGALIWEAGHDYVLLRSFRLS